VADPDLELRWVGRRSSFFLLALPAFLPSAMFFFTQNREDCPPGPSSRSATAYIIATPYKGVSVTRLHNYHSKITKK